MDAPGAFSLETVMEQDAQRASTGSGRAQAHGRSTSSTRTGSRCSGTSSATAWASTHNFMGNIDQPNFTPQSDASGKPIKDTNGNPLYNSTRPSVMEYNVRARAPRLDAGLGHVRQGRIGWIYANNAKQPDDPAKDMPATANKTRSGEVAGYRARATSTPARTRSGFCAMNDPDCTGVLADSGAGRRAPFIRCDDTDDQYSPHLPPGRPRRHAEPDHRQLDRRLRVAVPVAQLPRLPQGVGRRRRTRNEVAGYIVDQRRFLSQWAFDWSPGEIAACSTASASRRRRAAPSAVDYYSQLTYKFLVEMSKTNQMVAAFPRPSSSRPRASARTPRCTTSSTAT